MSWNYRVVRSEDAGGVAYTIREAHYANKGDATPTSITEQPAYASGETLAELRSDLERMLQAAGAAGMKSAKRCFLREEDFK